MAARSLVDQSTVYLSINDHPKYLYMAWRSISMLRKHNRKFPVKLFIYGSPPASYVRKMERIGTTVLVRKKRPKTDNVYLKWVALGEIEERRVLFLDADTLIFGDIAILFKRYGSRDFYARGEFGLEENAGMFLAGTRLAFSTTDSAKLTRLTKAFSARKVPIFNSGVMLFNNHAHQKIYGDGVGFTKIRRAMESRRLPVPMDDRRMIEEYAACVAIGKVKGLTFDFIDYHDSPFYIEWRAGIVRKVGIAMHVWSAYYPFSLLDLLGPKVLREYPDAAAKYLREYLPNGRPMTRPPLWPKRRAY